MKLNKTIFLAKTAICIAVLATAFTTIGCSPAVKSRATFIAIQLFSNLPITSEEQQLVYIPDSLIVCFYKNILLFSIPQLKSHVNVITDKKGNVIKKEVIKSEVINKYFVYHKDSLYGYHYDSLNGLPQKKQLVDSFLSNNTLTKFGPAYNILIEDCVLADSAFDEVNQILLEKYTLKIKPDESYNDSLFLYYSRKLNDIDFFSFSKEADSTKKKKLFRVRVIYNANPQSKDQFGRFAKEFTFEFQKIEVSMKKEIMEFLSRLMPTNEK
jgi:hypothetical protein